MRPKYVSIFFAYAMASADVSRTGGYDTRGDTHYQALARRLWESSTLQVTQVDPLYDIEDADNIALQATHAIMPVPHLQMELLEKLMKQPMLAIDRAQMRLVSQPVVEQGFWREMAVSFERLKLLYGRYVADVGNRKLPDRLIALKLRSALQQQRCQSFDHISTWHRRMARAVMSMMLLVYPIKPYYIGRETFPGAERGDFGAFSRSGMIQSVRFYEELYIKRARGRRAEERVIRFSLYNPTTYLRQHLDHLDTIRPWDPEVQLVNQLFTPANHKGLGKNIRQWKPTSTKSYRYVMGAVLQCLAEKNSFRN